MRVHLDFTGCRLNEAEIERMGRQLAGRGDALTADAADADMVIINTCAVTVDAARKSRQMILQTGRANPDAKIIATGCYAEFDSQGVTSLPGVAQVIGNEQKDNLIALIQPDGAAEYDREPISREALPPGTLGRTRAFVKAQDGCDNRCTFCVTTVLRGKGRSRPMTEIVEEIGWLEAAGYREAVLTGVHLGSYGHDLGERRGLAKLVEAILVGTPIPRLRLSSLEPWDLDSSFFDLWSNPRLCPHVHLPLQSGSDATLRRMARRTAQKTFTVLVEAARERIPELSLTGDMIVGFPGETDAEFTESLDFAEAMGFARLHVFGYSRRPGTAAASMPNQVPEDVKKDRYARMTALSDKMWTAFQSRHVGKAADVLWESAHGATPEGFVWSGLTGNYLRVFVTSPETLNNIITRVRLAEVTPRGLVGTLIA